MKYFIQVDDMGRIKASTDLEIYAKEMDPFEFPEDFDFSKQNDYRIVNGELIYDPQQEVKINTQSSPVASAVKYILQTTSLSSAKTDDIVGFKEFWPDWQPDTDYKQNDPLQYDEKYWRVSQDLTSSKIYPPGTSESLYYEIQLAPDGIIIYRTCHGKYDSVRLGEKRHYPDSDGPVYESLVDYNAYSPKAYPDNWKLVE